MEALEFLREYKRMCSNCSHFCDGCPLKGEQCLSTGIRNKTDGEFLTITSMVEQWSKEHPIITNACKFKEVFGSSKFYELVNTDLPEYARRSSWWDEPYKEP